MYLIVFADETAPDIDGQIWTKKQLGRKYIEARSIEWANIHDIPEAKLEEVIGSLEDSGVQANCFDWAKTNYLKSVTDPFVITLGEIKRTMLRMQQLVTKLIRIMSYAVHNRLVSDGKFPKIGVMKKWTDAGQTELFGSAAKFQPFFIEKELEFSFSGL